MNIEETIEKYEKMGYEFEEAESKVCQDIILLKISQSKFARSITIKGGVVMHSLSNKFYRANFYRKIKISFKIKLQIYKI